MDQFQQLASDYGAYLYALIFIWTFFEGETFVIFAGFAASQDYLDFTGVFFAAWVGSFAGDQLYFWIGRRWGTILLARIPRWRGGVEMALDWLRRYDTWFILTFRFVYGVRNFASFAMGMSGLQWRRFLGLNFIAAGIWAVSFVGAGYLLGKTFGVALRQFADSFGLVMLGIFALMGLAVFALHRAQRRRMLPPAVVAVRVVPPS